MDASESEHSTAGSSTTALPRACEACRSSKVRCNQSSPHQPCKRCAKSNRQCIVLPSNRRRNKQSEIGSTDLQAKIDAATASVQNRVLGDPGNSAGEASSPSPELRFSPNTTAPSSGLQSPSNGPSQSAVGDRLRAAQNLIQNEPIHSVPAFIEAGLAQVVDYSLAEQIFDIYRNGMTKIFPVVVFTPDTRAIHIRYSKPILFLAILVAASIDLCGFEAQQELRKLQQRVFTHTLLKGQSHPLELVQAFIISSLWHRPIEPEQLHEQVDVHKLSYAAAVNIGLIVDSSNEGLSEVEDLELKRAWLGCYIICANSPMTSRTTNVMRWCDGMDHFVDALESSAHALPSDKIFCQHVRLQKTTDEFARQIIRDPTLSSPQSQVQPSHRMFRQQLDRFNTAVAQKKLTLDLSKYVSSLYLHELAMTCNHQRANANFAESGGRRSGPKNLAILPSDPNILFDLIESVQGILQTFTSFDMFTIKFLPVIYFVRVLYAAIVLVKLFFAIPPSLQFGINPISREDLDVEGNLGKILNIFSHTVHEWPSRRFVQIVQRLQEWFLTNKYVRTDTPGGILSLQNQIPPNQSQIYASNNDSQLNSTLSSTSLSGGSSARPSPMTSSETSGLNLYQSQTHLSASMDPMEISTPPPMDMDQATFWDTSQNDKFGSLSSLGNIPPLDGNVEFAPFDRFLDATMYATDTDWSQIFGGTAFLNHDL